MPGEEVSQAKQQLKLIIEAYLDASDVDNVLAACDFAVGHSMAFGASYGSFSLEIFKVTTQNHDS